MIINIFQISKSTKVRLSKRKIINIYVTSFNRNLIVFQKMKFVNEMKNVISKFIGKYMFN